MEDDAVWQNRHGPVRGVGKVKDGQWHETIWELLNPRGYLILIPLDLNLNFTSSAAGIGSNPAICHRSYAV